jgi:hypothetical protein
MVAQRLVFSLLNLFVIKKYQLHDQRCWVTFWELNFLSWISDYQGNWISELRIIIRNEIWRFLWPEKNSRLCERTSKSHEALNKTVSKLKWFLLHNLKDASDWSTRNKVGIFYDQHWCMLNPKKKHHCMLWFSGNNQVKLQRSMKWYTVRHKSSLLDKQWHANDLLVLNFN